MQRAAQRGMNVSLAEAGDLTQPVALDVLEVDDALTPRGLVRAPEFRIA